jgi:hypothetical protein
MSTLATMKPVELPLLLTVDQIAEYLGEPAAWVHTQRRAGLIEPRSDRGALLFPRGAVVRLAAFQVLKASFGERSTAPAEIVKLIGHELDRAAARPWFSRADVQRAIELGLKILVDRMREAVSDKIGSIEDRIC